MYKHVQKCTKNVQTCTKMYKKICRGDRIDAKRSEAFRKGLKKQTASLVGRNKFSWQEISCLRRVVIVVRVSPLDSSGICPLPKTPFKKLYIMNLMTNLLKILGVFGKIRRIFLLGMYLFIAIPIRMLSRDQAFCSDRGKNGVKGEFKHYSIHFGFFDLFI